MKAMILLVSLCFASVSIAAEVGTDCSAMNQGREKIVKDVKVKSTKTKQASIQ